MAPVRQFLLFCRSKYSLFYLKIGKFAIRKFKNKCAKQELNLQHPVPPLALIQADPE